MVSTTVSSRRRLRGPALPFVPPAARILRSERGHLLRLSQAATLSLPFRQGECRCFVSKPHVNQSQISDEEIVIGLFFEKGFQFDARLFPSFLCSGMVAANGLCP